MRKLTHSFTTVPNIFINDERLDCFEFRIMCYLCQLADGNNLCFPSFGTIAKETHISESKVKKAVRNLIEMKYLSYKKRVKADGSLSSNMYLICDSPNENDNCTEGSVSEVQGGVCDDYNKYLNNNTQI